MFLARVLMLMMACVAAAVAGSKDPPDPKEVAAEYQRLVGEMNKLEGRGHWAGMDRVYLQLVALEAAPLTYDDHIKGASAAESLGQAGLTHQRLQQAIALDPKDEAMAWSARILAEHGEVNLTVHRSWKDEIVLEVLDMPFNPQLRNTITAAQETLAQDRAYIGMLPLGRYTLCGQAFEVIGGDPAEILVKR